MKFSFSSIFLLSVATYINGAVIRADIEQAQDQSIERTLYNRHAGVILQEPIERAQRRADEMAAKVKRARGEDRPLQQPHHPKYRPTGTSVPPLETGHWDSLALVKRRMEQ